MWLILYIKNSLKKRVFLYGPSSLCHGMGFDLGSLRVLGIHGEVCMMLNVLGDVVDARSVEHNIVGHYEPLFYKRSSICNFGRSNTYLSLVWKELEFHWKCRMQDMHSRGLDIATTSTTSCGEILFIALCFLVATEFDV